MHNVLVYGTLRAGFGNHEVMRRSGGVYVDTLMVPEYRMYSLHGGFPGVVPGGEHDKVLCELYEVPELRYLDRLEGYYESNPSHSLYVRQQADISIDDSPLRAWIYLYNHTPYGKVITDWRTYHE